jgi:hypothetical protein
MTGGGAVCGWGVTVGLRLDPDGRAKRLSDGPRSRTVSSSCLRAILLFGHLRGPSFCSLISCSKASCPFLLAFVRFFPSWVVTLVQSRRRLTFVPTAIPTRRRALERSRSAVARNYPQTQVFPGRTLTASSKSADLSDWAEGCSDVLSFFFDCRRFAIALPSAPFTVIEFSASVTSRLTCGGAVIGAYVPAHGARRVARIGAILTAVGIAPHLTPGLAAGCRSCKQVWCKTIKMLTTRMDEILYNSVNSLVLLNSLAQFTSAGDNNRSNPTACYGADRLELAVILRFFLSVQRRARQSSSAL